MNLEEYLLQKMLKHLHKIMEVDSVVNWDYSQSQGNYSILFINIYFLITKTIIENDLPQNISDFEKDTYSIYDKKKFDANIINFHSRKRNDKKLKIKENKEEDDIVYPDNENILDEDDIEFEGLIPKPKKRINITIEYDAKYKNLYNELSTQLDGNISYLNFYPKIIAIEGGKKIIKHILYISIFIIFLCMFFIEKIINLCCNGMNESLKGILSALKYFLFGIIYVIIMYIVKKVTHTNSFEVYINFKYKEKLSFW